MANTYTTRGAVKRAAQIGGDSLDATIDEQIDAASREIDRITGRRFIPLTAAKSYDWPQRSGRVGVVYLDEDLLSVTSLTKEGTDVTAIAAADYFLEPSTLGPPYSRIEIDQSSSAFFSAKDTHQRQIVVTGSWGYSNATAPASSLATALTDTTGTAVRLKDGSKADVGDTLLVESEQMFISGRTDEDLAVNTHGTTGAMDASMTDKTITVDGAPTNAVAVGEVLRIGSERMYVEAINSTTSFEVTRAYDGSTLAAHSTGDDVFVFRAYTVTRGENGTTAATHVISTAANRYQPPADIRGLCLAMAVAYYQATRGGWTGIVGGPEGQTETRMSALNRLRKDTAAHYRRYAVGAA